jgi:hypothetical protein
MSPSEIRAYLLMARALISQGAVDVEHPSPKFVDWARRAIRSTDSTLNDAVARLAEGTAAARGERYIELQLIAPQASASDPIVDLEVADRFTLLRTVAADHWQFAKHGLARSLDGSAAVLFSSFEDALAGARTLATEDAFRNASPELLLYAATYQPALPAEFLEEEMDPLGPARDFLTGIAEDEERRIAELARAGAEPIAL